MEQLRILYVPNEGDAFRQVGFRRPFSNLLSAGLIAEVSIFSLQWRIRNGGEAEQHRQDLVKRIREFKPNIVLMQHLGSTGLAHKHYQAMRTASDFEFIYHEADPYSRYLHPLPRAAAAAGRASDVVFTVGTGVFADNFRRHGASDVRWASHVFESDRYRYKPVSDDDNRPYDIVVVANRNMPRLRPHPNWRDRINFVSHLQERFGDRLAIFGNGWTGVGAKGPVDFSTQDRAIRSAWVSANWDHYADEPNYFSNRLPISLASGSIHATTVHPGYNKLFSPDTKSFLLFGTTPRGLAKTIERVLIETSSSARIAACKEAQEFAYKFYRQDDQLVSLLNYRNMRVDPLAASDAWDIDAIPLAEL